MSAKHQHFLPFKQALAWIALSVLLVSGSAYALYGLYLIHQNNKRHDTRYTIVAIVQTASQKEMIQTEAFAEWLGLSQDKPHNLFSFDTKEAEAVLRKIPLLTGARVKKMAPGSIVIDYTLRQPLAFLADFTNTALDERGYAFPFHPFFAPRQLPEIYLGQSVEHSPWGVNFSCPSLQFAFKVLASLQNSLKSAPQAMRVRLIDVSHLKEKRYGRQELIIELERCQKKNDPLDAICIRLAPRNYAAQLACFVRLLPQLPLFVQEGLEKIVIDMRSSGIAIVTSYKILSQ